MIHLEEPPVVDLHAVLIDDRVVEQLRLGRTPAGASQLVTLLTHWRDLCRGPGPKHVRA